MRIAYFDLETTGLDEQMHRICEVGLIIEESGKELLAYNKLVRPYRTSCYMPTEAYRVHGISEQDLRADGVLWSSIAKEYHDHLKSCDVICAYNSSFDIKFLTEAFSGVDLSFPEKDVIDPLHILYRFVPQSLMRKKNLGAAAKRYEISYDGAHRAVQDCRILALVLKGIMSELDIKSIEDLIGNKPLGWGKNKFKNVRRFDPFEALYNGLPKKTY